MRQLGKTETNPSNLHWRQPVLFRTVTEQLEREFSTERAQGSQVMAFLRSRPGSLLPLRPLLHLSLSPLLLQIINVSAATYIQ